MFDRFRYLFVKPDREAFVTLCVEALRRAGFDGEIERNADGYSIKLSHPAPEAGSPSDPEDKDDDPEDKDDDPEDKERGLHLGLNNFFKDFFASTRWQRADVIGRMVRTSMSSLESSGPVSFADARPHLLPALRDGFLLEATLLRSRLRGEAMPDNWVPTRPLASGSRIKLLLVIDKPESVVFVQQHAIDAWGQDFDTLLEIAIGNLKALTKGGLTPVAQGVYQAPWFDDHDVARVLLDDTLRGLDIDGDPVVVMPTRNHLFVTGLHNEDALEPLLQLAEEASKTQPSLISNLPLVRRWPNWESLRLAPTHPAYATWARMRVEELGGLFAEQKALLEAINDGVRAGKLDADPAEAESEAEAEAATETDLDPDFVASYRVIESEAHGLQSVAQWTRGVRTLLPEADLIAFYDHDAPEPQRMFMVPWERAADICEGLMEPWGDGLPRWRVETFPDATQVLALRAHEREFDLIAQDESD